MSIVKLEGIEYQTGAWTMRATFELNQRVTGLFGPSGAGKTTLLEIIAGLRTPRCGTMRIGSDIVFDGGQRIFLPPEHRRIGYMPQDLALFPHRTVEANLRYGMDPGSDAARFDHVVRVLAIGDLLARLPRSLSGGEKQRVALGRALLSSPRLLLLDEPLVNLESSLRQKLLDLFLRTVQEFNTPMIYVTHDAAELAQLSPEVLLIEQGSVRAQGKFEDLFEPVNVTTFHRRPSRATVE